MLSILDTDLYKFSMSYAYFSLYPLAEVRFKFTDRNRECWSGKKKEMLVELFSKYINKLHELFLEEEEMHWCIENIPYIPAPYWEWLSTFRYNPAKIKFWFDEDGVFQCTIEDTFYKATLYEIPILAIYSEIRNFILNQFNEYKYDSEEMLNILHKKIHYANSFNVPFSDFGTRRRYSAEAHEQCISLIKNESQTCKSTSNVYFAMKYDMIPTGTMAHEWIMFHGACFGYKRANYLALEDWIKVYQGNLGTALIDTYTTDSFLRTLTRQQALLLSGFRQDSGNEYEVGQKIIKRLKEFGIDPKTKLIVFSNSLNVYKAHKIMDFFDGKSKRGFGIGTDITCDPGIPDFKSPNVVMKSEICRLSSKDPWEKMIKMSDDEGKHMGDEKEFEVARYQLHIA